MGARGWGVLNFGFGDVPLRNLKVDHTDFCHVCSCKGVCGGRASDLGRAKCPMAPVTTVFFFFFFFLEKHPMSPLSFFFFFFFYEKHQSLHDLSSANYMYGNEMIIVDSQ